MTCASTFTHWNVFWSIHSVPLHPGEDFAVPVEGLISFARFRLEHVHVEPVQGSPSLAVETRTRLSPNHSVRRCKLKNPIGHNRWAIAEGYIPTFSHGPEPEMTSHETACLLNVSDQDAHVRIMIYFSAREPVGPYQIIVPANRTNHVRFNDLKDPEPVPRGTEYASVIESDVPIVVQHTRLDSRQNANALLTAIAYAEVE